MIRRKALLIGNARYDDGRFPPLPSTQADIWALNQVLLHRNIGNFVSATTLADLTADEMRQAITEFLGGCAQDELAVLYVSGHGDRVSHMGGEFFFVATDTDFDRVADTGVGAGFVNELLEQSWASQKVVMIDCCQSGGFAVGLRTSDSQPRSVAKSGEESPLTSRGVFVLSSSRAGEPSYAAVASAEDLKPSDFTGELVEALRTGKVGKDGSGDVSMSDLFDYVNRRMRNRGARQVPVHSTLGVDDRIIIASCPLGSAPILAPLSHRPAAEPKPAAHSPDRQPSWAGLLDYYRDCLLADGTETPLMPVAARGTAYVCLGGSERLLSGEVDEDDCTALPAGAVPLVETAAAQDAELWAGYPAVVLTGPRGGQPWRHPKFAPLLVRRVEVADTGGEIRLQPYGPVHPHPRLAEIWLGEEEAAQLTETYQSSWYGGQHDRMAVEARNLLMHEFELPCVQELRPDNLDDHIDVRTPGHGARNVAVLFLAPRNNRATKKLIDDFGDIGRQAAHIRSTALSVLSPDPAERTQALAHTDPPPARPVTPLASNEAQNEVIFSAMTRRLTVATGPPGTGKSQLVANIVATAVANGQTVLVASTNNAAVDEVWERCEKLVPGSVVRTGSAGGKRDYTETEGAGLRALRAAPAPTHNGPTAVARVDTTRGQLQRIHQDFARVAAAERVLRQTGEAREMHAAALHMPVPELIRHLTDPDRVAHKARRLVRARVLGGLRRRWFLGSLGLPRYEGDLTQVCRALADFAAAESTWRAAHEHAGHDRDRELAAALASAQIHVQGTSRDLLESVVRTNARSGRQRILGLLSARDGDRSDWFAVKEVLGRGRGASTVPAVAGWAVTCHSARRFPPEPALFDLVIVDEASQCAIPHVLPLLFRSRRALIIGDAMQLPHIAEISPAKEAAIRRKTGLHADWLEKYRLAFRRHSAFHAAERSTGGTLLLDEHFRCHPTIAAVSNELFYDGGLTVLTDVRNRPSLPLRPISWSNVAGRAIRPRSGGSWVNEDEISRVDGIVESLVRRLPAEATIGVVTPFKGQSEALGHRLRRHDENRVRIGTVHTFQGGERDVMVFSLVAGTGMHKGAISWVDRQLNLWNVAITRARTHLIVVGDAGLWRARGGVAATLLEAAGGGGGSQAPQANGDGLLQRLYQTLSWQPGHTVALGEQVNGHPADAVVRNADGATLAVLLDRAPNQGTDAARHLRLMLRRRELLDGGDHGSAALRYPAWRLFDVPRG
ncbi:caspase family protein [Pseudonocardia sp. DSM 110487]|nr:caspase family protein [Pseudonocardia sp. DSM 110487]